MAEIQKIIKKFVRGIFTKLAIWLNARFGKKITPDGITYVGLAAHIPIAYLIAEGYLFYAGLLLVFFGLFDTLDGALARVQKISSARGMFLDASTDRFKEALLYVGFVYFFADNSYAAWVSALAVFACGLSLSVSYVKSKGEAAIATLDSSIGHDKLNRIFEDGIGSFEVRMFLLVVGCIVGFPEYAIGLISIIALNTLIIRMKRISEAIS